MNESSYIRSVHSSSARGSHNTESLSLPSDRGMQHLIVRSSLPIANSIGRASQSASNLRSSDQHFNIPLTNMTKPGAWTASSQHEVMKFFRPPPDFGICIEAFWKKTEIFSRNICLLFKHAIDLRRWIRYSENQKASSGWHLGVQHQAR